MGHELHQGQALRVLGLENKQVYRLQRTARAVPRILLRAEGAFQEGELSQVAAPILVAWSESILVQEGLSFQGIS
jgi:hypothetical protein